VKPASPGYATYYVEPVLGGLKWMQGSVPTPSGSIDIYCDARQIKIKSDTGSGALLFKSKSNPICEGAIIISKGNGAYEMQIDKGKEYIVNYKL
jgi:hypothetical protein